MPNTADSHSEQCGVSTAKEQAIDCIAMLPSKQSDCRVAYIHCLKVARAVFVEGALC